MRSRKVERISAGFTLVELMIVVAIVGLLATIALPQFGVLRLRARRAELPVNLQSIRSAEKAYQHEWDTFTACQAAPSAAPGRSARDFGHTFGDNSDWDMLGWIADGPVFGQYSIDVTTGALVVQNFSAQAYGDLDGDGVTSVVVGDRHNKVLFLTDNAIF